MVSVPTVKIKAVSSIAPNIHPKSILSQKVNPEETLNLMYKTLPVGAERKLENFNGERRISVYRGNNFMNKITKRIKDPCITFIRAMKNAGTSENPKMITKSLVLDVPNRKDALEIYFDVPGDSSKGVLINLYRTGYMKTVKRFENLAQLRHDPDIIQVIRGWINKK